MCIYVYGSEIFPTTMRNICLGLCAVIARFGGVIAPYVVLLVCIFFPANFIPLFPEKLKKKSQQI